MRTHTRALSWQLHPGVFQVHTRALKARQVLSGARTRFAVTPLTEDAGLIEWVNGVEPLRHVVRRTHPGGPQADRQMGPTIKAMYDRWPKVHHLPPPQPTSLLLPGTLEYHGYAPIF